TDSWIPTSMGTGLPAARLTHTGIWTGRELLVWGGFNYNYFQWLSSGGRYDPSVDEWQPTSTAPATLKSRFGNSTSWTGSEMLLWGGSYSDSSMYRYCAAACASPSLFYQDADADGYGNPAVAVSECVQPPGYVANKLDCNDADPSIHPGAT